MNKQILEKVALQSATFFVKKLVEKIIIWDNISVKMQPPVA